LLQCRGHILLIAWRRRYTPLSAPTPLNYCECNKLTRTA
jgi:hypothetical protein